jgi:hypothetical protein
MQKESKIDYKEVLKNNGSIIKFTNVAPEGFVLVHEKTISDLKNIDTWIEWRMGRISLDELNRKNFEGE